MNKIIYVSGAYRSKYGLMGVLWNIYKARRVALRLWRENWIVICPHLNTFLFPEDGIDYINGDCEIVRRCDAIFMLRGFRNSKGAMIEYGIALHHKKEIIYEVKE